MPIQQIKKQSDIEKRLKLLRQQVYGRSSENPVKVREKVDDVGKEMIHPPHQYSISQVSSTPSNPQLLKSDVAFLRQDLFKITSFAIVSFGVQIVLYFLLTNNIVKLPFGG